MIPGANKSVTRPPSIYRPVKEALAEAVRELQVRQRCYDKWVAEGKLTETEARDRFERLCSACHHLDRLESLDRASDTTPAGAPENVTSLQPPQEPCQTAAG
jgi:hypothetical protein